METPMSIIDRQRKCRTRWWLHLLIVLGLVAFWTGFASAADLSRCPKLLERQRNMIEDYELQCIADGIRCDVLVMTIEEAELKVNEVHRWNGANAPYKERKLKSGFGACDNPPAGLCYRRRKPSPVRQPPSSRIGKRAVRGDHLRRLPGTTLALSLQRQTRRCHLLPGYDPSADQRITWFPRTYPCLL